MLPRLPAPAADDFAVHPPQRGDAPPEIFDRTGAPFADAAPDRGAAPVGRDVAERGRAGTADAADGRFGTPPVGGGGGFGRLWPWEVEEGGWGARVRVGVLVGGLDAQAGGGVAWFLWIRMGLRGWGGQWPCCWFGVVEDRLAAVWMGAGMFPCAGLPSGRVDFYVRAVVVFPVEIHHELGRGEWAVVVHHAGIFSVKAESCQWGEIEILS